MWLAGFGDDGGGESKVVGGGEGQGSERPRFVKIFYMDLKPLMTPGERNRDGEARGEAMASTGAGASWALL